MRRLLTEEERVRRDAARCGRGEDFAWFLLWTASMAPYWIIIALVLWIAFASCTPPRTVEHAPDLATAGPAPEPVTMERFAAGLRNTGTQIAEAFLPPLQRPEGYATWRRDWSLKRSVGTYRYLPHQSVCHSRIPSPMLHHGKSEPVAGKPVDIEGITAALGAPTDWPAVVLASIDAPPLDIDLGVIGMRGCRLAMPLTDALHSIDRPWLQTSRALGTGRIRVEWTPTDFFAGRTVTLQLLVFVPADVSPSGMVISSALQVCPGRP